MPHQLGCSSMGRGVGVSLDHSSIIDENDGHPMLFRPQSHRSCPPTDWNNQGGPTHIRTANLEADQTLRWKAVANGEICQEARVVTASVRRTSSHDSHLSLLSARCVINNICSGMILASLTPTRTAVVSGELRGEFFNLITLIRS